MISSDKQRISNGSFLKAWNILCIELGTTDFTKPKIDRLFRRHVAYEFMNTMGEERCERMSSVLKKMFSHNSDREVFRLVTPDMSSSITGKQLDEIEYEKIIDQCCEIRKKINMADMEGYYDNRY